MISKKIVALTKEILIDKIMSELVLKANSVNISSNINIREKRAGRGFVLSFYQDDAKFATLSIIVDRKITGVDSDSNISVLVSGSSQTDDKLLIHAATISSWNHVYLLSVGTDNNTNTAKRILKLMYPVLEAIAEELFVKMLAIEK